MIMRRLVFTFLSVFVSFLLKAEGSIDLKTYSLSQPLATGIPLLSNLPTNFQSAPYFRLFVYAKSGETIYLGSSNLGLKSIAYKSGTNPNQAGDIPADAFQGAIKYTSPTGASVTITDSLYRINSRAMETAGPKKFNAAGYNAYEIPVAGDNEGIWIVDFYISGSELSARGLPKNDVWDVSNRTYFDYQRRYANIFAFDVTVAASGSGSSSDIKKGRLFYNTIPMGAGKPGGQGADGYHLRVGNRFWVLTKDGYLYSVELPDSDPNGYHFSSTGLGVRDKTTNLPVYQSTPASGYNYGESSLYNKTFFNLPDTVNFPSSTSIDKSYQSQAWLKNAHPRNVISNIQYSKTTKTFSFTTPNISGTYSLIIDIDKDGVFGGTDSPDKVYSGNYVTGTTAIKWDGTDANGNSVSLERYNIKLTTFLKEGEVHFTLLNYRKNEGGIKVQRLNGINLPDYKLYWNDQYDDTWIANGATSVLPDGDSSNGFKHAFGGDSGLPLPGGKNEGGSTTGGGVQKWIDSWAYLPTTPTSIVFPMPPGAFDDYVQTSGIINIDVLRNDIIDPEDNVLSIVSQSGTLNQGTASVINSGINSKIKYTPKDNAFGLDSLQYQVTTSGVTSQAWVYIHNLRANFNTCGNEDVDISPRQLPGIATTYYTDKDTTNINNIVSVGMQDVQLTRYVNTYIYNIPVYNMSDAFNFNILVVPDSLEWLGYSSDWNNPSNWVDPSNSSNHKVPRKCTNVKIPDGKNFYPDLSSGFTLRSEVYGEPQCARIYFEHGGEVAKPYLLDYDFAFVELKLVSDRWNMISAPLRDMYSGDYALSENRVDPMVFMMQYETTNPETGINKGIGKWSYPFNTMKVPLFTGLGYAVWVDNENKRDSLFFFPKTAKEYKYFDEQGNYLNYKDTDLSRSNNGRFVYEELSSTGTFTVNNPLWSSTPGASLIIGNPLMSHIDFNLFQQRNANNIAPGYKIWTGNSTFVTYMKMSDGKVVQTGDAGNGIISPMQSFFVDRLDTYSGGLTFTPEMSITKPGMKLRSMINSNGTEYDNVFYIEAVKDGQRSGQRTAIRYAVDGKNGFDPTEDSYVLFSSYVYETPVLYTLIDGKAADINTLGDLTDKKIELGMRTSLYGNFNLKVTDLDVFDPKYDIFLEDKQTGKVLNLRENAVYSFDIQKNKNISGRLFLSFALSNQMSIKNQVADDNIFVEVENGTLNISSKDTNISAVEIYDLNGRKIYSEANIDNSECKINLKISQNIVIVKVLTANSSLVKKVIL